METAARLRVHVHARVPWFVEGVRQDAAVGDDADVLFRPLPRLKIKKLKKFKFKKTEGVRQDAVVGTPEQKINKYKNEEIGKLDKTNVTQEQALRFLFFHLPPARRHTGS